MCWRRGWWRGESGESDRCPLAEHERVVHGDAELGLAQAGVDAIAGHQIDHVIADKHGGPTLAENLALSCLFCNRRKGSDLSSIDAETGEIATLFNPRTQAWMEHFAIDDVQIRGLTAAGRATVHLLQLNAVQRLIERRELKNAGRFPPKIDYRSSELFRAIQVGGRAGLARSGGRGG